MRAHVAVIGVLCAAAVACSFPDVTYQDAGAGSGGSGCEATGACINKAESCRSMAENSFTQCKAMCGQPNKPTCSECSTNEKDDLKSCATACEACVLGSQGCDGTASCDMLVGL